MKYKRLLAKSTSTPDAPKRGESLQGHISEVLKSSVHLADMRAEASLKAAKLPVAWQERLRAILWLAAFAHDLGKCSEHFQEMVRSTSKKAQFLRHEAASLWLCWPGQPLADWLRSAVDSDEDYLIAIVAAAGHHRKFLSGAFAPKEAGAGSDVALLCSHKDFHDTLRMAELLKGLAPPPTLTNLIITGSAMEPQSAPKLFTRWQLEAEQTFPAGTAHSHLLAITKALLLCADVAGSAFPKTGEQASWLREQFRDDDKSAALRGIIHERLEGSPLRLFQLEVAASTAPVTLATAGCGSGKTLAAVAWAAEQHPWRRLWLTYPTTGTATEGFRDYMNPSALNARLVHGRAEIDYDLFGLRDGSEEGQRELDRLDALREWGLDAITCTVDTVLGLVQNNRRGVYHWPNIAHGAVVFDEIHSYDDQLFGALLRFLEALPGIPALLMTASLPAPRLRALEELCSRVHRQPLARVQGPSELELLPRYCWKSDARSLDDALSEAGPLRTSGGKVLWVSNTVDRCMAAAARAEVLGPTLRYHSRFRYIDRIARHRDVINAFDRKKNSDFVVACTTQVAEMSLDLSADLLLMDLAPIPAMIQRLGRLNRKSDPKNPAPPKGFIVLRPESEKPYTKEDLAEAERWLERLRGRALSQRDLVEAWEQPAEGTAAPCESAWLDGSFCTESKPLRQASDGITVLRHEDASDVRRKQHKAIELAIPMNRPPKGWREWPLVDHLPVPPAEAISYDPKEGARWVK